MSFPSFLEVLAKRFSVPLRQVNFGRGEVLRLILDYEPKPSLVILRSETDDDDAKIRQFAKTHGIKVIVDAELPELVGAAVILHPRTRCVADYRNLCGE